MHRKILLYLVLSISLLLASCSEEDNPTGGDGDLGKISAKIDGTSWTSDNATGVKNGTEIQISGTATDHKSISITIDQTGTGSIFTGLGYYQISDGNIPPTNVITYNSTEVTYEITEYDEDEKIIGGTFSFTGTNAEDNITKEITDGTFKVKIVN